MKTFASLFWNFEHRRLRALWRIILQALLFGILMAVSAGFAQLVRTFTLLLLPSNAAAITARVTNHIGDIVAAFLCLIIAAHILDRRPFADFGFHFNRRWWMDFGFGLALGALLMLIIFLVEQALGWIKITNNFFKDPPNPGLWTTSLVILIHFIAVGFYEEIFSRGYQLRNIAEGFGFLGRKGFYGLLIGWLISSSVFGFLHLGNPNSTWISTINLILAGIFLGLGYVLTGELAIPIGIHITWNFFQGVIFGFPVSGSKSGASFIEIQQLGPDSMTGGAFGPEAGLIGIAAILLGCLLIIAWVQATHGQIALQNRLGDYQPPTPPAATA